MADLYYRRHQRDFSRLPVSSLLRRDHAAGPQRAAWARQWPDPAGGWDRAADLAGAGGRAARRDRTRRRVHNRCAHLRLLDHNVTDHHYSQADRHRRRSDRARLAAPGIDLRLALYYGATRADRPADLLRL